MVSKATAGLKAFLSISNILGDGKAAETQVPYGLDNTTQL
jgi:hypothetical protein